MAKKLKCKYGIVYRKKRSKSNKWDLICFERKPTEKDIKNRGFEFIYEKDYEHRLLKR